MQKTTTLRPNRCPAWVVVLLCTVGAAACSTTSSSTPPMPKPQLPRPQAPPDQAPQQQDRRMQQPASQSDSFSSDAKESQGMQGEMEAGALSGMGGDEPRRGPSEAEAGAAPESASPRGAEGEEGATGGRQAGSTASGVEQARTRAGTFPSGGPTGERRPAGMPGDDDAPGTASGGEWSPTGQKKVDQLRGKFSVVDGILHEEAEAIEQDTAAAGGAETAPTEVGHAGGIETPGGPGTDEAAPTRSSSLGTGRPGIRRTGRTPADIGDGANDDVVAQQLRELAENETDPEIREAYWCEYRKYKGLVKECDGSESSQ